MRNKSIVLTLIISVLLMFQSTAAFADNTTTVPWHDHSVSGCSYGTYSCAYTPTYSVTIRPTTKQICTFCGQQFSPSGGLGGSVTKPSSDVYGPVNIGTSVSYHDFRHEHGGIYYDCIATGTITGYTSTSSHTHTAACYRWSCSKTENNDTIPPTASYSRIYNSSTNTYTLSVLGTDTLSGIKTISKTNKVTANSLLSVTYNSVDSTKIYSCHTDESITAPGSYTVIITDNAGNSTPYTVVFVDSDFDSTPPIVSQLTSPDDNTWSKSKTISVTASDSGTGLKQVTDPIGVNHVTSPFNYVVNANGTYNFTAYDNSNNSQMLSVDIDRIDTSVPTIATTPSCASYTNDKVTVNVTASDTGGSNVKRIECSSDNISWLDWVDASTGVYEFTDNKTVYFRALDNAGNYSIVKAMQVDYIDKDKPQVSTSISVSDWSNADVVATITSSDIGCSGVGSTEYSSDCNTWNNLLTGTWTFTENGNMYFRVKDRAGNISDTKEVIADMVDKIKPEVTTSSDAYSNSKVDTDVKDQNSGIKKVEFN